MSTYGRLLDISVVIDALAASAENDYTIVGPSSLDWTSRVDDLRYAAPLLLWVRGNSELLASRMVAITGTRRPSEQGRCKAAQLARSYVATSWNVASGGSYGIDAAAHVAALDAGGRTVALLASGVDVLFPSGNVELLERIAVGGTIVSERAPGTEPRAWRFQRRNSLLTTVAASTAFVEPIWRAPLTTTSVVHSLRTGAENQ